MDCVKIGDLVANRFRLVKDVGAGSFASVFVADDLHSGQTVALKMLRSERFGDGDALQRFESRELRLLARIEEFGHSPHVVRLLEKRLLRHEGSPFLVLEYIDGPSLKEWLAQKGKLDLEQAARIGAGLARGLSVIHTAGGVHRDLKPSNVRMRHGKTPVLVDLGIARALWETQKLTQGIAPLTPRYAAPEQRAGLPATPAADVYALGVCLQEMLAGQNNVPPRLVKIVAACLTNVPQERPAIQQIVHTLDGFAHSRSSRPSLWPLIFLAGCSAFPGENVRDGSSREPAACVPLAGAVRQKRHHEATSTDSTFEWWPVDPRGEISHSVRAKLPDFDPLPNAILDDGADGHYEILGWSGETCRHFSVVACENQASVHELETCFWPKPHAFAVGDINRDDVDDLVVYNRTPATPQKQVSLRGAIFERHADGSGRLIKDAFDLTSINDYHVELVRRTGDVDRDGCPDLVVATYSTGGACSSSIHVLFGDCRGKFELYKDVAHVPLPVNRSDIGDVDEDGFVDLVTGPDDDGDPGQTFLLRGNGIGFGEAEDLVDAFPDSEEGRDQPGAGGVLLEDVNGDGHLDIILLVATTPAAAGKTAIHLGHGDGTFETYRVFTQDDLNTHGNISFLPIRGR